MTAKSKENIKKLVYSALFLALALLLPFLTGQIPTFGKLISPMHIPAFLCGFICGPLWGAVVGFISPLLRSLLFGMPKLYPMAVSMAVELLAYGFFAGLFRKILPKNNVWLYVSLVFSMVAGRLIYTVFSVILCGLSGQEFSLWLILAGTVSSTWVGIIVQLVIIPPLVMLWEKYSKSAAA